MKTIKYSFLSILFLFTSELYSQIVEGNTIVWKLNYTNENRINVTVGSAGINVGKYEIGTVKVTNRTASLLKVAYSITVTSYCGYSKSVEYEYEIKPYGSVGGDMGLTASKSYFHFEDSECSKVKTYNENLKSKISNIRVEIVSITDLTKEKQEREQRERDERNRQIAEEKARQEYNLAAQKAKEEQLYKERLAEEQRAAERNAVNNQVTNPANNTQSTSPSSSELRPVTNPQALAAIEQQKRLNALKEQQEAQRRTQIQEQERLNYERAMEYERQRQEDMRQNHEKIDAITDAVKEWNNQRRQEEEARREREWQRQQEENRRRQEEQMKKEAFERKIANRRNLIAEFKPKDIPLSTSGENAKKIYYFIYAYDPAAITADYALVYISNVFEIGQYGDGTWPYKSKIEEETAALTPYKEVLHGYYYSKEEAEELRQTFIFLAQSNDIQLREIVYGGKPVENAKEGSFDSWSKPSQQNTTDSKKKETFDPWQQSGNSTTPKSTPQKKEEPAFDPWAKP